MELKTKKIALIVKLSGAKQSLNTAASDLFFVILFNWTGLVIGDLQVLGKWKIIEEICLVANTDQTAGNKLRNEKFAANS